MVKITCGACEKPLSIDENKLPMKEVAFPCPLCKTKVEIDRRKLDPARPETMRAAPARGAATPTGETRLPAEAQGIIQGGGGDRALVAGVANDEIASAARSIGFDPFHLEDLAQARDYYLQEFPELILINPPNLGQPPDERVAALLSMNSVDRRRGFAVLVGDSLRTMDGNAAFLYQVNLTVATKDLGQFAKIYKEARREHDRLAAGFPGAD